MSNTNNTVQWYFGTSTISTATLIVQPANQTITYGGSLVQGNAAFNLGGTYAGGWTPNDNKDTWIVQPTIMATSLHARTSILYVTAAQVPPDYALQYHTAILTVKPAALTIISMNQPNITYGQAVRSQRLPITRPTDHSSLACRRLGRHGHGSRFDEVAHDPAGQHPCRDAESCHQWRRRPGLHDRLSYGASRLPRGSLILTADTKTKVYGAALPTLTASAPERASRRLPVHQHAGQPATRPTILTTATAASRWARTRLSSADRCRTAITRSPTSTACRPKS